ncbi:MAG: methylase involved in ubiquinone/menaquinone biosynthesis, partial [Nocardioidaceae bacterium]|nr:methylase involved in ubiquinone/menaquinone biosynthesis [Nocardioidaceae bacterium]
MRWGEDPLWATVYSWTVDHEQPGGLLWRLAGMDLSRLYAAAAPIGELPAGSRVLDVPSGSGVALRGLRPGQGLDYVAADLATAMLERTLRTARERGVADQVRPLACDVGSLPLDDGSVDL